MPDTHLRLLSIVSYPPSDIGRMDASVYHRQWGMKSQWVCYRLRFLAAVSQWHGHSCVVIPACAGMTRNRRQWMFRCSDRFQSENR